MGGDTGIGHYADVRLKPDTTLTSCGDVRLLHNDAIVGLATAHILTLVERVRDVPWLTALVVDESARGIDVGRRRVERVGAVARGQNCEQVSVTTHERRPGAHAFYARADVEHTGCRFGKVL